MDTNLLRDTAAIDPAAFREAMSRFASAVHLVTTDGKAGRRGVTATAVVGVSDDPATVLVCLNAKNPQNELFRRNGCFAVNILAAGSEHLAEAFAGKGALTPEERFALGRWRRMATDAPVLDGALASFDCRLMEFRTIATHHVLLGEVAAIQEGPLASPLLYHARGYRLL